MKTAPQSAPDLLTTISRAGELKSPPRVGILGQPGTFVLFGALSNNVQLLYSYWVVILHTALIYLGLCVGLRLVGGRQMGELSAIDLTIILLLGSAVETAMVVGNTSLPAGLVSVATLLTANRGLHWALRRSERLKRLVVGEPLLLVHNGEIVDAHLRKVGLCTADLMEALRERGHAGVEEVRSAVLEVDGSINVVPKETPKRHNGREACEDAGHHAARRRNPHGLDI